MIRSDSDRPEAWYPAGRGRAIGEPVQCQWSGGAEAERERKPAPEALLRLKKPGGGGGGHPHRGGRAGRCGQGGRARWLLSALSSVECHVNISLHRVGWLFILPNWCKMGVRISPIYHKFAVKWVLKRYKRPGSGQSRLRFWPVLDGGPQGLRSPDRGGEGEATGRPHARE